jgi:hypothetical protein
VSRSVRLEVRRVDEGWTTVDLEAVDSLRLGGAPGPDGEGLVLTLIATRADGPSERVTDILDIADRHHSLLDSEVPTVDGVALPAALRDNR